MVLGVLLGLIPIPIPGVGIVTLGIGGGPLIVALILGKLRRTGPMLWIMPLPANIVLRNFGLAMFLATVGVNAGQPFVRTVSEFGLTMLFIGVAVLLTTVLIVLLVGHFLMKIPYDDLVGVASGATGNPAILVYSTKMAPTERPDIGYAMIFPSMTIVKVIAVQIVGTPCGRRCWRLTEEVKQQSVSQRARPASGNHLRRYPPAGDGPARRRERHQKSHRRSCNFACAECFGGRIRFIRRDFRNDCQRRQHRRNGGRQHLGIFRNSALRHCTPSGRAGVLRWTYHGVIAGAELFTGNSIIVMAWASRQGDDTCASAQLGSFIFRQFRRRDFDRGL